MEQIEISDNKLVDERDSKIEKLERENIEINTQLVEMNIELNKLKYKVAELELIVEKKRL